MDGGTGIELQLTTGAAARVELSTLYDVVLRRWPAILSAPLI